MGNEYSEDINAQDLVDNGVQFASRGRRVFSDVNRSRIRLAEAFLGAGLKGLIFAANNEYV